MKWCCFLFWFVYRLILACLAHFNWFLAVYTNCIYFSLWKSYDLLWFWMHLTLCSCFQSLRRENYMVVWSNLIFKRCTKYPDLSYKMWSRRHLKMVRMMLTKQTDATAGPPDGDTFLVGLFETGLRVAVPDVISEEEAECRKYVYIGQAVDSQADLQSMRAARRQAEDQEASVPSPTRPSRPLKESSAGTSAANGVGYPRLDNSTSNGSPAQNRLAFKDTVPERPPIRRSESEESKVPFSVLTSALIIIIILNLQRSGWSRIIDKIPIPLKSRNNAKKEVANTAGMVLQLFVVLLPSAMLLYSTLSLVLDVLAPNFTNTYDVLDEKLLEKRARRDKKMLTQRVRRRIREELREAARLERKRKRMADAIELLLQLLRMMTSFAVLVGNIRKTFIPAQFKYLRPGQHAYDNYELLLLFRVTTFLDVSMFWTNIMWVYCLQWHLCCRLGFMRFWIWLAILSAVSERLILHLCLFADLFFIVLSFFYKNAGVYPRNICQLQLLQIAMVVMIIPMSYAMNEMDLSWCRFMPNSTLEKYQPRW
ncbi:unnamed protein product [Heligmosomoides polygyrus]|uniref:Piezo_RRas_bdg domain-containing protein n=1 Tax=Heligmosomoides polygyrus TaxID=6339 RepID=A0A183FR79_HELPZ|nr:unnamed protein product [Heligmosomoides polygyrus]